MAKKEKNNTEAENILACRLCEGSGIDAGGKTCPECLGYGRAEFLGEELLYWNQELSVAGISMHRFRIFADRIINGVCFLLFVFGILSFTFWSYRETSLFGIESILGFWSEKSFFLFLFWAGLIPGMFAYYRISEEVRRSEKIVYAKFGQSVEDLALNNFKQADKADIKRNISLFFSNQALKTVENGYISAVFSGSAQYSPAHLAQKLLSDPGVGMLFFRLGIDRDDMNEKLGRELSKIEKSSGKPVAGALISACMFDGFRSAYMLRQPRVETLNLFYGAVKNSEFLNEALFDLDVSLEKIYNTIQWINTQDRTWKSINSFRRLSAFKPKSEMNRAYTAIATPILDTYGRDLTLSAKYGQLEFVVGRDEEIEKAFELIDSGRTGIIFTGNTGVGKTSLIYGIAQRMAEETVPEILGDKRLIELDIARLVSGGSASNAEEHLLTSIDEASRSGNVILAINNIENIVGITAGGEQSLDMSDVLANAVRTRGMICFATVSSEHYSRHVEKKALGAAFAKIEIAEPDTSKAIQIISSKIPIFEARNNVFFTYHALEEALEMSKKYIHDKYLPTKTIEILELSASQNSGRKNTHIITKEDIARVVSEVTHIPVMEATKDESELLLNFEDRIHELMVDQEEAVSMVSASLRRARAQMNEGKRPLASFLFLGPTGVGKTELAKTIAKIYFGDEKAMIRLDMSEYQHPDSIAKMIGDTEGNLGYLTEAVRKQPFALLLLDEFEKAYSSILNLFLQVMDDGRLTDGQGRTIDFTNTIIIATSNVGALFIQEEIKKNTDMAVIKEQIIDKYLNQVLRPELINRYDGVIVFKPLGESEVIQIAKLMLDNLARLLEEDKGMFLEYSDEGVREIARLGFDPEFGARPLRRVVQEKIEDQIANKILSKELIRRDTIFIGENARIEIRKGRKI